MYEKLLRDHLTMHSGSYIYLWMTPLYVHTEIFFSCIFKNNQHNLIESAAYNFKVRPQAHKSTVLTRLSLVSVNALWEPN